MKTLLVIVILFGAGCTRSPSVNGDPSGMLPKGAKVVKDMGNGWVVFQIDDRRYIYRVRVHGEGTTEVIAPF